MVMKAMRDGAKGGITKFILFGFLVMAVAGLVLMDVGGVFRGGVGSTDAAKIGGETIPITTFDRTVRRSLGQIGITTQEAYQQGYITQLIGAEVRNRIWQQTAEKYGLLVGDKRAAAHVKSLITPLLQPGQRPQDVLAQLLAAQGMSERDFENSIKREMMAGVLTNSIRAGFAAPAPLATADLWRYQNETRSIAYIPFKDSEIESVTAPSEEQLNAFYESMKMRFRIPERREIHVITVDDAAMKETLVVTDEEIESVYERDIDLYYAPKRWVIQQALLTGKDKAEEIAALARDGKSIETAVEEVTGRSADYLGESEAAEDNMLDEVRVVVTEAAAGEVLGPVQTPLGYSVIKVTDIKEASVKPLSEVRASIQDEIKENQLLDQIYDMAGTLDDLFAGGATPENVAEQIDVTVTSYDPVDQFGRSEDNEDAFAKVGESRDIILETAFQLFEGESSEVIEMPDGSLSAIHVAAIQPASHQPLEDVRDELLAIWNRDQKRADNRARVLEALARNEAENKGLRDLAQSLSKSVKTETSVQRNAGSAGDLNARSLPVLFAAKPGQLQMVEIDGGLAIAEVMEVTLPETVDRDSDDYKAFAEEQTESMQNNALVVFLQKHSKRLNAKVNDALLERTYGTLPEGF